MLLEEPVDGKSSHIKVKITDFGLAKQINKEEMEMATGQTGTTVRTLCLLTLYAALDGA